MTKGVVPEGFTMAMVVTDMLPVVFFGAATFTIGLILNNVWIDVGALIAFVSGLVKVIWKLIVVWKRKNVWSLFVQMRIVMPVGLIVFLIGLIVSLSKIPAQNVWSALTSMPQLIFFLLGFVGMIAMIVFSVKLDSTDPKANWIDQTTNGIAQACFFICALLIYLG